MSQQIAPAVYRDAFKNTRLTREAEGSLYEFLQQAWSIVEPGVEFTPGWHIRIICEHLEALKTGEIRKLLVNIPPRHSKSTIISVIYPVWQWIHNPAEQFLTASYSAVLATRDATKSRRLLLSPWFQERWGEKIILTGDQNSKQRYENTERGYRIATSVGGTATGEGGSTLILDDPHGAQDAQSDAMRESALEWFDMVWSTRLNDPKKDKMITIMQRLHESDCSGHILNDLKNWEHVCLPAEYDEVKRTTKVFPSGFDPRTTAGSLLWPERFDAATLNDLKKTLGEYGVSGQLQQSPSPSGGGMLKTNYFQLWPAGKALPYLDYVIQSVDPAQTERTSGDPTAFTAWGFFTYDGKRGAILLDAWAEHLGYPELRSKLISEWKSKYGKAGTSRGRHPDIILIEEKSAGLSIIQDLRQANVPVVGYNPGRADKITRAHRVAPVLELGELWLPESNQERGKPATWARAFVEQVGKFPVAAHDDYVDTMSQCIIYALDADMFELPYAEDPIEDLGYDPDYKKHQVYVNPYMV